MTIKKKTYSEMVNDGIGYLANNTDITYFGDGSIARALIEATALEISRLQNFVTGLSDNAFLSTASGIYLDLFGEMLGVPRLTSRTASATAEDGAVRFYVNSGTLGSRLPHPTLRTKGLIPANTIISNGTGNIEFYVLSNVEFPINARSTTVPVIAAVKGSGYNVGTNQLVSHNLGIADVFVTNDISITTGGDVETDVEYKFRLSKAMTTRLGANKSAVQLAAMALPGLVDVRIQEYARGAGTFDILLIPRGNKVTEDVKQTALRSVNQVIAFGIYPSVREPNYVPVALSLRLRYKPSTTDGQKITIANTVQSALLSYLGNIPMGGELVINQIRSTVLGVSPEIVDLTILELCLEGKSRTLRNFSLKEDELFVPDNSVADPISIA